MKTLLVSVPTKQLTSFHRDNPSIPLGLAYLAAMLEKEKLEVSVVDMCENSIEDIKGIIKEHNPDIVGISCFTQTRKVVFRMASLIKKINKKITIVLGGSHATFLYEQILKNYKEIDIVVLYEGEFTFPELIKTLADKGDLNKVKGIAFRKGKKIVKTEERETIHDLDILPFPAYHLFDLNRYVTVSHDNIPGSGLDGKRNSELKCVDIITTRGCPNRCTYCSTTVFWKNKYRAMSPKRVADLIEHLYKKYEIKVFSFDDDTFTVLQGRVIEICKEIIKRKIKIRWSCGTRVNFVSEELLKWMKKAGCYHIFFGVESGSSTILRNINKLCTKKQILDSIKLCKKIGINAGMQIMVGNSGENNKTIKETMDLIKETDPPSLGTSIVTIFPGTELYELSKRQGFINDAYWLSDGYAPIYTYENSLQKLRKYEHEILLYHYLKKRDYLRYVSSFLLQYPFTRHIVYQAVEIRKYFKLRKSRN